MEKKLYRSQNERMIAGVCGGVAEYFEIDPSLVRLLFVIFAIAGGPGILAYIIMLLIVPEVPMQTGYAQKQPKSTQVAEEDVVVVDENGEEI